MNTYDEIYIQYYVIDDCIKMLFYNVVGVHMSNQSKQQKYKQHRCKRYKLEWMFQVHLALPSLSWNSLKGCRERDAKTVM